MKDSLSNEKAFTSMLFPFEPQEYWQQVRQIIREEISKAQTRHDQADLHETPSLTYKPLYKMVEVCKLLHVSKPTIYDRVKHGKLKPYKIRSRVYFLWQDIQQMVNPKQM